MTFPITLIYFLYKVPKVVQIPGLIEMNQLILDSLWKSEICFLMKGLVVIVKESGNPVEVDKELGGLEIVFHDQLFNFNFGVGNLVIQTDEGFALDIYPKSLHATVLMQTVYNAVIRHSGGFLKHVV